MRIVVHENEGHCAQNTTKTHLTNLWNDHIIFYFHSCALNEEKKRVKQIDEGDNNNITKAHIYTASNHSHTYYILLVNNINTSGRSR